MYSTLRSQTVAWSAAALVVLAAPACSPLLGDVLDQPGARSSLVQGEIRSVDTRRSRIEVRNDNGRTTRAQYDRRTQVVYGNRQYPVSALERGDRVLMRVSYDRNGAAWADRVEVRSSVRDHARTGRVERISGTVMQVDARRRYFTISASRGSGLVVYAPRRLDRDDARRFDRLRRGDRVRADVRPNGRNTAELVRFR